MQHVPFSADADDSMPVRAAKHTPKVLDPLSNALVGFKAVVPNSSCTTCWSYF